MKNSFKFLIIVLVVLLSSCSFESIEGSGKMVLLEFDFADFENISVKNTFNVQILESEEFRVVVKCNENIEQCLKVSKEGNTLNLFLEGNKNYFNVDCDAIVYMPTVKSIQTKGASKVTLSSLHSDRLEINVAGASKFTGEINVKELDLNIAGASKIALTGNVENGNIDSKGASKFEGKDLIFNKLTFKSAGASKVTAHVTGELDIELNGASIFDYFGNPKIINKEISGLGKINQLN
jgi:hypothetical protein